MRGLCCVALAVLGVLGGAASLPNPAKGVWLHKAAAEQGALCLDGSPPLYYIRHAGAGSANATKWYLHFQGGGWCTSIEECSQRASTRLGSSVVPDNKPEWDFADIPGCNNSRWCGAPMVNDPTVNPLSHDWNAVLLMYCDGGSFTGDNATPTVYKNQTLYFRGFRVLEAIITDLLQSYSMDRATEVIVGGDSAGGLASFIHTDYIAGRMPVGCRTVGLPDSGFFLDYNGPLGKGCGYHDKIVNMTRIMNSSRGLNPRCVAAHGDDHSQCAFAQHTAMHSSSPLFIKQSMFDSYQTKEEVCSDTNATAVNAYGAEVTRLIRSLVSENPKHAAFLDSCHHHCGQWNLTIAGQNGESAFQTWWSKAGAANLWDQGREYPCDECCAEW